MPRHPRLLFGVFLLAASAAVSAMAAGAADQDKSALPEIHVPDHDDRAAALPARKAAQEKTRGEFGVFAGFTFTDRQPESGITFRHRIVDDAGKHYKAVHYDHGNGIVAADVDGDGR